MNDKVQIKYPTTQCYHSHLFYHCEKHKCDYHEYYVPMENETSASREIASLGEFC